MPSVQDLEQHHTALTGHCYRMMGSASDADDAVQETMVRAWRSLDRFEERSSLRTWLYRIATRVCLDALADRERRARPIDLRPAASVDEPLTALPGSRWIEPIPDTDALPADADPAELVALRQSIRLAFVAALQQLPAKQRAALLLADVLGWPAADIAESLDTSVAAVNSALQRARTTLATRNEMLQGGAELSGEEAYLVDRYVSAFERYDVNEIVSLLHEDATLSMPPYSLWLRGHDAIAGWLSGRGSDCRGSRLVATAACASPAFGQYRPSGPGGRHEPWALLVLEVSNGAICGMNSFLDTAALFPRFRLPLAVAA
jgi:RNA polymerase sigma-70 factor (ECF subfamily)